MQARCGAGVLLLTPCGEQWRYMVHLNFKATNNLAKYKALIFGLSTVLSLGIRQLLVKGDSHLISSMSRENVAATIHYWPPTYSMPRS
jgi:ribonuclease HI